MSCIIEYTITLPFQMEEIARGVFKMTLEEDAPWKRGSNGPSSHMNNTPSQGGSMSTASVTQRGSLAKRAEEEVFSTLVLIDHKMHRWAKSITNLLEGLGAIGVQGDVQAALETEEKWLRESLYSITHDTEDDEANALLRHELRKNVEDLLAAVTSITRTLAARTLEDLSQREHALEVIDTSVIIFDLAMVRS